MKRYDKRIMNSLPSLRLTFILLSNVYSSDSFNLGKLVHIFIKHGTEKCGKWSSPRQVLSPDSKPGSITLFRRAGKMVCAAVEDVHAAPEQTDLSKAI